MLRGTNNVNEISADCNGLLWHYILSQCLWQAILHCFNHQWPVMSSVGVMVKSVFVSGPMVYSWHSLQLTQLVNNETIRSYRASLAATFKRSWESIDQMRGSWSPTSAFGSMLAPRLSATFTGLMAQHLQVGPCLWWCTVVSVRVTQLTASLVDDVIGTRRHGQEGALAPSGNVVKCFCALVVTAKCSVDDASFSQTLVGFWGLRPSQLDPTRALSLDSAGGLSSPGP